MKTIIKQIGEHTIEIEATAHEEHGHVITLTAECDGQLVNHNITLDPGEEWTVESLAMVVDQQAEVFARELAGKLNARRQRDVFLGDGS